LSELVSLFDGLKKNTLKIILFSSDLKLSKIFALKFLVKKGVELKPNSFLARFTI